jgi:sugar lactone lactonase YvrE
LETRRDPGRLGLITAIGFSGADVFFADASARCIHRYDPEGEFLNDIGDQHRKGGFHIPNGVVDFAVDAQGILHVANPGMHRVERYNPAGELLGRFGRFDGVDPQGFGGCCNPTNLTVDAAGRVVVTEKAGPRAKVYDAAGQLLSVVAADVFDPAAKNMDVAVDSAGRIYVADTVRLEIRVFQPTPEEVTP